MVDGIMQEGIFVRTVNFAQVTFLHDIKKEQVNKYY